MSLCVFFVVEVLRFLIFFPTLRQLNETVYIRVCVYCAWGNYFSLTPFD